jgi:hypothetical protein
MALYTHHEDGIRWVVRILFIKASREFEAIAGRYFNMTGEILSRSDAMDFLEAIAYVSSGTLKSLVRTWVGETQ